MKRLIIDNFAGGGGASTGIELAIGRSVDVAINHDAEAVLMHSANHPATKHYCQSIMAIDPLEVTGGAPVDLAWFSPDCKHFSKAKGGQPREKRIRDLAWIVVHWVKRLGTNAPRVIMLENVEEFRTWGPLLDDGRPCPDRKGETFDQWVRQLRRAGYKVEWRELRACDYGAPTIRKRLFMVARRDGLPIVWPKPTHGPSTGRPYRVAADIIDWSIPCPSIFTRDRELKPATCRRIAAGIKRFVLDAPAPFIVPICNTNWQADRAWSGNEPLRTITTAKGGDMAVVAPVIAPLTHHGKADRGYAPDAPLPTVTAAHRGELAMIAPVLSTMRNSGQPSTRADVPMHTIMAEGAHKYLVAAFMAQHNTMPNGGLHAGRACREPLSTTTQTGSQQQVVTSNLIKLRGTNVGHATDEPLHTLSAGGTHMAEVRAFMVKYYGNEFGGHGLDEPAGSVTTRDRFGLVTCTIAGEEYVLTDIGMRMLSPRELFRAQGFPDDYIIDPVNPATGKPLTKTAQVRMCGNSVCPPLPEALVRANLPELCEGRAAA